MNAPLPLPLPLPPLPFLLVWQLRGSGRLVFNAHFGTAERGSGAVIVYYSDDGGKTYTMANTTAGGHGHPFKHMDESTMTEAEDGGVVINMRNDPYVPASD